MKNKNLLFLSLIFLLLGLLAVPTRVWTRKNATNIDTMRASRLSPVIMIPGSSATVNRFDPLVKLLNQGLPKNKRHSLLKMKVYNSGKIISSGSLRKGDNEPIIVVGFENNHDGYVNIKKQSKMFAKAFNLLTKTYKFNNFKALGHSNGGLIYTAFLENYYAPYSNEIKVTKLMTIGSPYNFDEQSDTKKTQMLTDFIKKSSKLPKSLVVYSVAGTENYSSDGLVPIQSVQAGKYIYQKKVKSFMEITVTGVNAQHSSLPQNKQIVRLIKQYMLKRNNKGNFPSRQDNDKISDEKL